ncbi:MAG: hypothetical protein K2Y51_12010 [Gammaproteobacteria bacterium]|nr:hypothetical protein [Gammaproteobacteria bacterium]
MNHSLIAVLGLAAASLALDAQALTVSVEAFDNATVQPGGPRSGSSGKAFFNIEGADNGSFASYGVARFDLTAAKGSFDEQFGVGGWKIDLVSVQLTQSNASFSTTGGVGIRHTSDDSTGIQPGSSPLAHPVSGDFADLAPLVDYTFTPISTGTLETHVLFDASGANPTGSLQLVADVMGDNLVTLLFVDLDPAVAATYAGVTNASRPGATLAVEVSAVPVPAALPLLGGALGLLVLRRRG